MLGERTRSAAKFLFRHEPLLKLYIEGSTVYDAPCRVFYVSEFKRPIQFESHKPSGGDLLCRYRLWKPGIHWAPGAELLV